MMMKPITASVEGLFIGPDPEVLITQPVAVLPLDDHGIIGHARHRGSTLTSGIRDPFFQMGTDIPNMRHLTLLDAAGVETILAEMPISMEQLQALVKAQQNILGELLELAPNLSPEIIWAARYMGLNLVIDHFESNARYPNLHSLPNGTWAGTYSNATPHKWDGNTLLTLFYNAPCRAPDEAMDLSGFVKAALGRRGFAARSWSIGRLCTGDMLRFVPSATSPAQVS